MNKRECILVLGGVLALSVQQGASAEFSSPAPQTQPQIIQPSSTPIPHTPAAGLKLQPTSNSNSNSTLNGTSAPVGVVTQTAYSSPRYQNFGGIRYVDAGRTLYQQSACLTPAAAFGVGSNHGINYFDAGSDVQFQAAITVPFGQKGCHKRQEQLANIAQGQHFSNMVNQCLKWLEMGYNVKICKNMGITKIVAATPQDEPPANDPPQQEPLPQIEEEFSDPYLTKEPIPALW